VLYPKKGVLGRDIVDIWVSVLEKKIKEEEEWQQVHEYKKQPSEEKA
jgi:hypothetical protein